MSEDKMDDEPLCDSEEEVFCGPVTSRELDLMTRRKLMFRRTEVDPFKQIPPRISHRFRRQRSDEDEHETSTKASASDWKKTTEEMCQDSVETSKQTCGTLAPPSTPEPCFDIHKLTTDKGLKQMTHISEETDMTSASPLMEQISLHEICEPDVGSVSSQTLDAAGKISAVTCVEDSLTDILEDITDYGFSSDSIDTSYEEEVYYTGEVDVQGENKGKINMNLNLTGRVEVPGHNTIVVNETEGCVSYVKMTNDNREHSVMSDIDSSEIVQFHAEHDRVSKEDVRMSKQGKAAASLEIDLKDCDMEDTVVNIQCKDVMKVIEQVELPNKTVGDISVAYVKESIQSACVLAAAELAEVPKSLIKMCNASSNVVIGNQEIAQRNVDDCCTIDSVEYQEITTQVPNQEGNSNSHLETLDELDYQECVSESTDKQDSFNDLSTLTFQNQELPSFVNVRKKKYSTFFRSSTEDENKVQSPLKDTNKSRIPRISSRISHDRCSILSNMNDDLIEGRSNVAERTVLASSPTLDKLAEISKKYQHNETDSAKPEKENYFLNALHRRYGNAKLTTRMSDLSLRSPRGGRENSSLSSLNESNENEKSSDENGSSETNKNHFSLMSDCNRLNLSYSHPGMVIESDSSLSCPSDNDTETPKRPTVNCALPIQSANYSMISEPEGNTNEVSTGLPQDVKMFSVLNTIQGKEAEGKDVTSLFNNEDAHASCSKTFPGNVSSVSADDDGGFLSGFTEIALLHATLPECSTPKKCHYSIPVSMVTKLETTKEDMEPDIAQPDSPTVEFNDTLEDILLMETYGMDYILGNKDRFSKPGATTLDKSLSKLANDVTSREESFALMVSAETNTQHSKELPTTQEAEEEGDSHPIVFQNYSQSTEKSFGEESTEHGGNPKQNDSKSFDANKSRGRLRLFTDVIPRSSVDENTKCTSTSPGIIPSTPDTKIVRSIVRPKKFFSDKSSVASENDNPKTKQAIKKDFVFVKPKIIDTKPQANHTHETTPVKRPLLNKLKSPGVKVVSQCSSKGFVSPASDKFKSTLNSGSSSSVSRIPRKSAVVTPGVKKNPIFSRIQSPIGAYIKNSPTPTLVTNKNTPVVSATKQIKATATSGTQKKRLFPVIHSSKTEGRSVHYGSENIDTNNVGSVLPQVSYQSAPSLKLDTPSKMKMPHISDSLKRLVEAPMTRVLKHEGRLKVSTLNSDVDSKHSPERFLPRFAQRNPNDSCVVVNNHDAEISVVVSKEAARTDTIGH